MYPNAHFECCSKCNVPLYYSEYAYSIDHHGAALCNRCTKARQKKASPVEKKLNAALRKEKIPALSQYDDGHKTVDFAFKEIKLFLEIDGPYHEKLDQQLRDSMRDLYSRKAGFETIRISNSYVSRNIGDIVKRIKQLHNHQPSTHDRKNGLRSLF